MSRNEPPDQDLAQFFEGEDELEEVANGQGKLWFDDDDDGAEEIKASHHQDHDDDELDLGTLSGEGVEFLHEAHEAINRLYQKTNKRGKAMRQPKRADSWH